MVSSAGPYLSTIPMQQNAGVDADDLGEMFRVPFRKFDQGFPPRYVGCDGVARSRW
jgi:hypothetical protein